jgi:hypothetical protein
MVEGVRTGGVSRGSPVIRDGGKTSGVPFSIDDGAPAVGQKARLSSVAGIGMDSMLALQAVDEGAERDRKARKRATAVVKALTGLQRTLLTEEDPAVALRTLNELATADPSADDPALGAILRAIVLRARLEVARGDVRKA